MRALVKYFMLLSLIIIIGTLPEVGMCQTDEDVETAVLPLPANLQSNASVMTYTPEGTLYRASSQDPSTPKPVCRTACGYGARSQCPLPDQKKQA